MCFSVQVDTDLKKLAKRFKASISKSDFDQFYHQQSENPAQFKGPDKDDRIFPNYFAPVMVLREGRRTFLPMRYRIRPHNSTKEIPSKYNVFNARLDSLESRATWKGIFMRNHGIFPFLRFYEWVSVKGKKILMSFTPKDTGIMWGVCLFDIWNDVNNKCLLYSFATITSGPPLNVKTRGHDRYPIFINEKNIDRWLQPQETEKKEIKLILSLQEEVEYQVTKVG